MKVANSLSGTDDHSMDHTFPYTAADMAINVINVIILVMFWNYSNFIVVMHAIIRIENVMPFSE